MGNKNNKVQPKTENVSTSLDKHFQDMSTLNAKVEEDFQKSAKQTPSERSPSVFQEVKLIKKRVVFKDDLTTSNKDIESKSRGSILRNQRRCREAISKRRHDKE